MSAVLVSGFLIDRPRRHETHENEKWWGHSDWDVLHIVGKLLQNWIRDVQVSKAGSKYLPLKLGPKVGEVRA